MISKSLQRNTFQKEGYLRRQEEAGKLDDPQTQTMIKMYEDWDRQAEEQEQNTEWQKDNLEYDLRTTDWILEKVRASDAYAQNLYAAMCNREFCKLDTWPLLTGKTWGCSWRSAGGIIANMTQTGDYIDWYCSGIGMRKDLDDEAYHALTKEQQEAYLMQKLYVSEGQVTEEIQEDLLRLGWTVLDEQNDE